MTVPRTARQAVRRVGVAAFLFLAAVWIASAWFYIQWIGSAGTFVMVGHGVVIVRWAPAAGGKVPPPGLRAGRMARGMVWWHGTTRAGVRSAIGIPIWMPAVVALLLSAGAGALDARDRRRIRHVLCPACRYDRRGLPPAAPCPECNAPAPPHT